MGFTRPSDIAVIAGIGLLVVLTMSGLIVSTQQFQNLTTNDPVFTTSNQSLNTFKTSSASSNAALTNSPGQTDDQTDTSIYRASLNAVLGLGEMVSLSIDLVNQFVESIGIPDYFLWILTSLLTVTFAVVVYSWFRGASLT